MGISDWLEEATPDRREVTVCLDRRLISELAVAEQKLEEAEEPAKGMLGQADSHKELTQAIEEMRDRVREKSRTFVFEGLGWGPWRDLLGKHPPTEDQADVFNRAVQLAFMPHAVENIGYNAETFIPAAIAASCVEPGMAEHEARTLLTKSPPGVIERLWTAVLEVNLAGATDPIVPVAASDAARATGKKSKRPSP